MPLLKPGPGGRAMAPERGGRKGGVQPLANVAPDVTPALFCASNCPMRTRRKGPSLLHKWPVGERKCLYKHSICADRLRAIARERNPT
jgi:hypothetical protein